MCENARHNANRNREAATATAADSSAPPIGVRDPITNAEIPMIAPQTSKMRPSHRWSAGLRCRIRGTNCNGASTMNSNAGVICTSVSHGCAANPTSVALVEGERPVESTGARKIARCMTLTTPINARTITAVQSSFEVCLRIGHSKLRDPSRKGSPSAERFQPPPLRAMALAAIRNASVRTGQSSKATRSGYRNAGKSSGLLGSGCGRGNSLAEPERQRLANPSSRPRSMPQSSQRPSTLGTDSR